MNRIVPLILAVALFMELMDSTVIATSLPAIAADINTNPIALKLAMTSYLVALAIFIPISGWIGDRFGVRRIFMWAIFVFMVGSVACAMAYSLPTFVAARFFQGMGGAMMSPLARLVLVRSTPKNEMVNAISWFTVPALVGPMMGPPIGGFLTTYFSWHWIFLINIPIGALGIITAKLFLPPVTADQPGRIDWMGFGLAGTAFAGIMFGLSVVTLPALPPLLGVVVCAVGVVALISYVAYALRAPHPLLDLAIFKSGIFTAIEIGGFLLRLSMGAWPFLLPLMLQIGFGLTPFETGLILLYAALSSLAAKFVVAPIFVKFGFRNVMIVTGIMTASGIGLVGFTDASTPIWLFSIIMFASGFTRSVFFSGATAVAISELNTELTSHATVTSTVLMYVGMALGVALGGGVLEVIAQAGGTSEIISIADFKLTFFIIGGISLLCCVPFFFLPKDAGENVSGHRTVNTTTH